MSSALDVEEVVIVVDDDAARVLYALPDIVDAPASIAELSSMAGVSARSMSNGARQRFSSLLCLPDYASARGPPGC